MTEYTPVEHRNGRFYKREDLHRHPSGVNGAKWRQCQHLMAQHAAAGHTLVITGASVLSPQHAMTAVAARQHGMESLHIIGATTPEKAIKHKSIALAMNYGAHLYPINVGYNPALQAEVKRQAKENQAAILHYGVTTSPDATQAEIEAFHAIGAAQAHNIPTQVRHLIAPLGSGNSATSLIVGLHDLDQPPTLYLVGIGPSRHQWALDRATSILGHPPMIDMRHIDLHGLGAVTYSDKKPYTADGITLHPTYEGKVATWLDANPAWCPPWAARQDDTCLWIVGGPL